MAMKPRIPRDGEEDGALPTRCQLPERNDPRHLLLAPPLAARCNNLDPDCYTRSALQSFAFACVSC